MIHLRLRSPYKQIYAIAATKGQSNSSEKGGIILQINSCMMSNLAKFDFKALNINGDNYLSLQLDAKIHL